TIRPPHTPHPSPYTTLFRSSGTDARPTGTDPTARSNSVLICALLMVSPIEAPYFHCGASITDIFMFKVETPGMLSPRLSTSMKRSEEHTSELQSPDHLVCRL